MKSRCCFTEIDYQISLIIICNQLDFEGVSFYYCTAHDLEVMSIKKTSIIIEIEFAEVNKAKC